MNIFKRKASRVTSSEAYFIGACSHKPWHEATDMILLRIDRHVLSFDQAHKILSAHPACTPDLLAATLVAYRLTH